VLDENNLYSYNTFEWMGREVFPRLVEAVSDLRTDNSRASSAFLLGPIGVGKSHLLAALALHLRSQGKVVVYIPHCGDLFSSPVKYTAAALLCAFAGSSAEDRRRRHEIRMLDSTQAIEKWCSQQSTQGIRFYFLIDQLNELEPIATSMESRGTRLKHFLLDLYRDGICVRSSSTNDQHGHSLLGRGKREDLFDFHQTLTKVR
jgi:Cdc6-like AAA superfamily ATPase